MKYMSMLKIALLLCILPVLVHGQAGVGIRLKIDSTGNGWMPVILEVLPNTPAAMAGIKTDMYVLKANGVSCANKTIEEVVTLIRGAAGTAVTIVAADDKKGRNAITRELVRVAMNQQGGISDPVEVFYGLCEYDTKALRKQGHEIVKTFNSDCGSFYFNFNADTGLYRVVAYTMDGRGAAGGMQVSVCDNRNEAGAVKLEPTTSRNNVALKGSIRFAKAGVGSIKTELQGADGCKALYIVVYK